MAATATPSKLSSMLAVNAALSGDATAGIDITFTDAGGTWLDMRDYEYVMFILVAAALTGTGLDADDCHILSNPNSDGSGTDYTVVTHSDVTPNAAGDYIVLEATAEQLSGNRYCTVNIDANNAADNIVIIAIRGGAKIAKAGLTADYIS